MLRTKPTRLALAFVLGLTGGLGALIAMDPSPFWVGGLLVFTTLLLLRIVIEENGALLSGLLYGFGFSLVSFYWMPGAIEVYAKTGFGLAIALGFVFHLYQAVPFALGWWLASKIGLLNLPPIQTGLRISPRLWFLPLLFVEILWLWLDLSLVPWTFGAFTWTLFDIPQLASVVGALGLSVFLFSFWDTVIGVFFRFIKVQATSGNFPGQVLAQLQKFYQNSGYLWLSLPILLILISFLFGQLNMTPKVIPGKSEKSTLNVALLQTNFSSRQKYLDQLKHLHDGIRKVYSLGKEANKAAKNTLDLIVVPESAVPFKGFLWDKANQDSKLYSINFHRVLKTLAYDGATNVLAQGFAQKADGGGYLNSLGLVQPNSNTPVYYAKTKLVPFGEYVPWYGQWLLAALHDPASYVQPALTTEGYVQKKEIASSVAQQAAYFTLNGFKPNPDAAPLEKSEELIGLDALKGDTVLVPRDAKLPAGQYNLLPLICYEDIFAASVSEKVATLPQEYPSILLNVTNDSWFGERAAFQHFTLARLRSIENGMFMLRATLTGPSSAIRPDGRLLVPDSETGKEQIQLLRVPLAQYNRPIFFRAGLSITWLSFVLIALVYSMLSWRDSKRS